MARKLEKLKVELAALEIMSPAQLGERWAQVEKAAPPGLPPALVRRLLAQRLQERQLGGLSATVVRELERGGAAGQVTSRRRAVPLPPGARLVREWNGQTITVEVREDGFWWKDRNWRSLSQIARQVTGAHWSGPRFFGLTRRG